MSAVVRDDPSFRDTVSLRSAYLEGLHMSSPSPRRLRRLIPGLALVVAAATLTAAGPTGATDDPGDRAAATERSAAAATENLRRISGRPDGKAGLEVWKESCIVPGAPGDFRTIAFGYGNGQPLPYGPLSVAWSPVGDDAAIALRAPTNNPRSIDRFDVQVFHPEPSVEGFVSVSYIPDRNVEEEWLGRSTFTDTKRGWHPVFGAKRVFQWTHIVGGGTRDGLTTPDSTLRALAKRLGTKRDTASMGFAFGCDGKQTYIDGLRVGSTTKGWNTYDMTGRPSSATLNTARFARTCQLSAPRYPDPLKYSGKLEGLNRVAIWRLDERGNLLQRIGKPKRPDVNGRFSGKVNISRNSVLVAYAPNTNTTAAAFSKAVRIFARPQTSFASNSGSAVRGRGLTVAGRINTGEAMRYTALYTHWTGKSWTPYRAVKKGRTNGEGQFRFQAPTGTLGISRISILSKGTQRVNAALSRSAFTYRVNAPQQSAPAPSGPSGPPTSTGTPPPVAPAPAPQPPSGGGDNEPAPMPEPGRVVVEKPGGKGYGPCGWTPPTRRP